MLDARAPLCCRGASYVLLGLVADWLIRPLATPALFLDYEDVMKRPEHLLAMQISVAAVDRYLDGFADAIQRNVESRRML